MSRFLVTGGAGFIGSNLSARLIRNGHDLTVLDNLSRAGAGENVRWLRKLGAFRLARVDVRDADAVLKVVRGSRPDAVIHLASQTAVTTSIADPRADFETNTAGTINVLEALRRTSRDTTFIFASTNKVYGRMQDTAVDEQPGRCGFRDYPDGIPESRPVDFHSPYGCSKGAADLYTHDYHATYNMPTVVLRQSCIYGPRQFGIEDQGWVTWFTAAAVLGRPITVYGDGRQVRDVLFIDDLIDCYIKVIRKILWTAGRVYNIGGGPRHTLSLLELIERLERILKKKPEVRFDRQRPGDQKVYISDVSRAAADFGWKPKTDVDTGLRRLVRWVCDNEKILDKILV